MLNVKLKPEHWILGILVKFQLKFKEIPLFILFGGLDSP